MTENNYKPCPICGALEGNAHEEWCSENPDNPQEVLIFEPRPPLTATQQLIREECRAVEKLLLSKNRKYGDSAINPTQIFSKLDPIEQIKVRIDDKVNRVRNQQEDEDEDVEQELIGYLILLRVARRVRGDVPGAA